MGYEWNSDLETGHELIDEQHKAIFAAMNRFADAFKSGKGRDEIERTLHFLIDYAEQHFRDEEKLQKQCGTPDFARHKQEHMVFKRKVYSLKERFTTEGPTDALMSEIYMTVGDWLLHHIQSDDFVLAAYIREPE